MNDYKSFLSEFNSNEPCQDIKSHIEKIEEIFNIKLPEDYISFMEQRNGGEGFVGENYLGIYQIEEIIKANEDYEVEKYIPGLLLIGSNLGGEAFALDFRIGKTNYIMIPFMFDEEDIIVLSQNIEGFMFKLYNDELFD